MIIEFIRHLKWLQTIRQRVIGKHRILHVPDRIDRPTDFKAAADSFQQKGAQVGVGWFERVVQNHQPLACGMSLFEGIQVAICDVAAFTIAENDQGVGIGDDLRILRPAHAHGGLDTQPGGIQVGGEKFAAGRVFMLAGPVTFGSGDEQDGFASRLGGGQTEAACDQGGEDFHDRTLVSQHIRSASPLLVLINIRIFAVEESAPLR